MSTSTKLCGLLALIAWLPLTIGYERPSVELQPVVSANLVGTFCDSCVALANDLQPAAPKEEKIDGSIKKTDGKARNEKPRLGNSEEIEAEIRRVFAPLGKEALDWALRVSWCESGRRQFDSLGNLLDNGYGCLGIFQFKRKTFATYCEGRIESARDQIKCAAKMWRMGLQHHWVCK